MAITSPTYDPASTAAALAEKYVAGQQQVLKSRSESASTTEKGLSSLRSALSSFQSALAGLSGTNKTMFAQSALFSDTTMGSASAKSTAAPGTYSFFVEKLATASQVSYSLKSESEISGKLTVKLGLTADSPKIDIDLDALAASKNAPLNPRDIAAAINASEQNSSLVTASVISTAPGEYELVLTAKNTGGAGALSVNHDDGTTDPSPFATAKTIVEAEDAVIRIGSKDGTPITQPTNIFTGIDGVTATFTRTSTTPVTLTVGTDSGATNANVQSFVDAYNKLKSAVDTLVAPADPSKSIAGGAFAGDSGVAALRDRLVSLLRPTGGDSLATYGITANRQGTLSLDTTRLNKALAQNPTGLDTLIGSTTGTATPTGIAGKLDTYLKGWTSATNGQLKTRQEAVSKLQVEVSTRQTLLDTQYDTAYQRYLMQFTQLQALQNQMSSNSSMFDALFSNDKD